jgi:hypothetical protein
MCSGTKVLPKNTDKNAGVLGPGYVNAIILCFNCINLLLFLL